MRISDWSSDVCSSDLMEALGSLKTLKEGGTITAGNASQVCDGASGVLVVSERALKAHGLTPLARVHNLTVTAGDPVIMLEEPIPATRRALERAGMRIGDIDLYEVRSDERRVGKECVSTCRSRWSPYH